jgi:hypothetical protein
MKHHQNFERREENSNFDYEKIIFQTDQYFLGVVKGLLVVIKFETFPRSINFVALFIFC